MGDNKVVNIIEYKKHVEKEAKRAKARARMLIISKTIKWD